MTRNKKIALWSAVIIILVVVVMIWRSRSKQEFEYETETAQAKDVIQTVAVTGELVSEQEVGLNFEIGGRIKSVDAYVGKTVAKGDVIAMINDDMLSQEYNQAEAALAQAVANAGSNDDVVREAEQAKDNAEDYLEETEDLEDQKVDAAEQASDDADDYYDDAQDYYNKVLSDDGADASTTKNAKLTLDTARARKNAADDALETAKKARDLAMISAENSVKSAKESLKTAQSDYAKSSRDSAVASARAAYNIALENLDRAVLRAPLNGTITELNYKAGEVLGSSLSIGASTSFAKMITSDFILESNVPESDIVKVKIGQNATVTFDAFEEIEEFSAKVVEIEPASTVIQDVVYYVVKLALQNVDGRLKAGMNADIDIHTAERRNVIAVPRRVVNETAERKTVDILVGENQVKTVEIETGLRGDEGEIEVTSGLNEGDKVIILKKESK